MAKPLGGDKRSTPRDDTSAKFKCFAAGRRFVSDAVNLSSGGAFVQTDRVVRPGTVIILEEAKQGYAEAVPHLVGTVVHFAMAPIMGAGIKWVKAIAPGGLEDLTVLLSELLGVEVPSGELARIPKSAREHPVSYDFASGSLNMERRREPKQESERLVSMFGIKVKEATMDKLGIGDVRVVHSEAPKQKRATIGEDDASLSTRTRNEDVDPLQAARELEDWMRFKRVGKKIDATVLLVFEGKNVEGQALSIASNSVWVQSASEPADLNKRLLIQFPIETAQKVIRIIIVGEVQKKLRNRSRDGWGASIKIVTLNEGDNVGAFKRYIGNL